MLLSRIRTWTNASMRKHSGNYTIYLDATIYLEAEEYDRFEVDDSKVCSESVEVVAVALWMTSTRKSASLPSSSSRRARNT